MREQTKRGIYPRANQIKGCRVPLKHRGTIICTTNKGIFNRARVSRFMPYLYTIEELNTSEKVDLPQ